MTSNTKERPIIFSGPMVRAILDGRKTQTRRVIKPQPWQIEKCGIVGERYKWERGDFGIEGVPECLAVAMERYCPYGVAGDRLWVRETWGLWDTLPKDGPEHAEVFYRATDAERHELRYQLWRPSIHMPRWASRITLEVTGVRVERLQDISEGDARAEGIADGGCLACGESEPCSCENPQPDARDSFAFLWDGINSEIGFPWHSNPWVWVVEFQRVEAGE